VIELNLITAQVFFVGANKFAKTGKRYHPAWLVPVKYRLCSKSLTVLSWLLQVERQRKATAVQDAITMYSCSAIRQVPGSRDVLTGEMTMGQII